MLASLSPWGWVETSAENVRSGTERKVAGHREVDTTKSVTLSLPFSQTLVFVMDPLVFLYWRSFVPSGSFLLYASRLKRGSWPWGWHRHTSPVLLLIVLAPMTCRLFLLIFLVSCVFNVVYVWCMYICVCMGACAHCMNLSRPEDDPGCLPLSLSTYF